jgi:hypothetical protein
MFSGEISLTPRKLAGNGDGTFPLQTADDRGHGIFRRDFDTPMHMIGHQMPLNNPAFLLAGQFVKNRPQGFPDIAKECFTSSLWHKDDMILAIPSRMRQAVVGVRQRVLLSCGLIKPPKEHSTPGLLKALLVSLVKPVAYLKDRVRSRLLCGWAPYAGAVILPGRPEFPSWLGRDQKPRKPLSHIPDSHRYALSGHDDSPGDNRRQYGATHRV